MIIQERYVRFAAKSNRLLKVFWLLFIGAYSWPLVFRLPRTLKAVFKAFWPTGFGIADRGFWAFSRVDAGFRTWYDKIARDYRTQGRFGYVWDDGLGMPLGVRIYNNLATYTLLYWLGPRRMMALGYTIMLLFSAWLICWRLNLWVGLAVVALAAGSPLLVGSYTHLGKPEVFWWGIALPVIFLMLSGNAFGAGLLWSVIAWANLSVSVMLVFLLGLTPSLLGIFPGALLLGALPGIVKHGARGIYMWRSGFLAGLAGEQSRLWKRPWHPTLIELLWWLPFSLSIGASAYRLQQPLVGGVLLLSGIGLYWINFRAIYLNDAQSFHLAYWSIGLCYAAVAQSLPALFAILVLAYVSPSLCGFPIAGREISLDSDPWARRLGNAREYMRTYPALTPMTFPQPPTLMAFFDRIPDGARILAETHGDPRTGSEFRAFWQWAEEFLPRRQIDLASEMYTRMVEPELADGYLSRFNATEMTDQELGQLCRMLGASYVVAHSRSTVESLEIVGFESIAWADLAELDEFRTIVRTPPITLTLLKNPENVTVIDPAVEWERSGNELIWDAKAGQSYVVRYRYDGQFGASQGGLALDVEPWKPLDGIPLRFMQIRAAVDGPLILKFHPRWI